MDWVRQVQIYMRDVKYPMYTFEVVQDTRGSVYLRAHYLDGDTQTGKIERQFTRRWLLSPEMSKSEIVATAFKCVLTSMEHRTREWFTYRGKAIYHPHYDVDALHGICEIREERHTEEVLV